MLGVKQGDPPSPLFFKIYMKLLKSSDISNFIELGHCAVPCIFCADDLLLISKTKEGLQELLNILDKYSADWKMKGILKKTKVVIFNKQGRILKSESYIMGTVVWKM